ncbi:hypothetical protein BC834DRAFT_892786 [Gloeopeniophorella convolvens]|nr:hypothetical protein BC834DRAFT_892786 [Gloeopeniophorella convolvens]
MASENKEDKELLDKLYPIPSTTGLLSFPGPTHDSAQALLDILRKNRNDHHIFFNDSRYHNHSTHHLISIWALGASPEIMADAYNAHTWLRPAVESPEAITDKNFSDHLSDGKFYSSYLTYFSEYLRDHTPTEAFEHFVLSAQYNVVPNLDAINAQDVKKGGEGKRQHPEMLNRFLAALLHPFIHLAYGFEFGIPGQVAEGLALTAVHQNKQSEIVPTSLFSKPREGGTLAGLASRLTFSRKVAVFHEKGPTFAILRQIREHPKFSDDVLGPHGDVKRMYPDFLKNTGDAINELVNKWSDEWLEGTRNDADIEKRLEGMVEEIIWTNVVWFGVGGWQSRGDRAFNADFFIAHLVTSSLFLFTLILPAESNPYPVTSLTSRLTLLKTYFATCIGWQIAQGRRELPLQEFYAATREQLTAPPAKPAPAGTKDTGKPLSARGGAWERIISNTIAHPDQHLPKATRALAIFAARWGLRPAGYFAGGSRDGLEGREILDGTLFVRVAGLTLDRLGWAHEAGKEVIDWDRDGFPLPSDWRE